MLKYDNLPRIAVDTEGTGLNVWRGARPFAVSMCTPEGETLYWEWEVDPKTRLPIIPAKDVKELNGILNTPDTVKTFWNSQYDILALSMIGVHVMWPFAEVSFMARSTCNIEFAYALKPLSKKYLDFSDEDQSDLREAVVKCRRICKKLGWNVATKKTHGGDKPWLADYWLPETLWRKHPDIAEENEIPRGLCEKYAVGDAERTIMLDAFYRHAMAQLDEEDERLRCQETYEREMELLPITMEMERVGVTVDGRRLKKLVRACELKMEKEREVLIEASGREDFNHNSPQQVVQLLFEPLPEGSTTPKGKPRKPQIKPEKCLRLPVLRRTKTGQPKTDAEALMPYVGNPVVYSHLAVKANEKALSTFFKKYEHLSEFDVVGNMWLHPRWGQSAAITSRYTCKEPNLQQVSNPKTSNSRSKEFVVDARQAFIPRKGRPFIYTLTMKALRKRILRDNRILRTNRFYNWYAPDYSQVEVVIFADIAGEPTMLQAIKNGADIHSATANKIWGGRDNERAIPAAREALKMANDPRANSDSDVEDFMESFDWDICEAEKAVGQKIWRKLAKTVTFTKIFGGGTGALMSWIDCSKSEAIVILDDYESSFPEMAAKVAEIVKEGRANGYVVNPYGRRLEIDKWKAYRAVNYLVQSAAADLMKDGMRKCNQFMREAELDARIAMTIHDELIFEIWVKHCFKSVLRKLCDLMADHGGRFSVPLEVDMERIVDRWSIKRKVELKKGK